MLREIWEQVRRLFGEQKVMVEVITRRNGRLIRVPVPVRVNDAERLYRRKTW